MKLSISNRQQRVKLDRNWVEGTCGQLISGVLDNLRLEPAVHRGGEAPDLSELERRGVLSLAIVSDAQMRKLNSRWRGKDSSTDVLSFPLDTVPPPAGLPWEFGELIISAERARDQAAEYGHSLEREFSFLFVHGLLHLLGFDHETPQQEKEMFARQKRILDAAGIKRDASR